MLILNIFPPPKLRANNNGKQPDRSLFSFELILGAHSVSQFVDVVSAGIVLTGIFHRWEIHEERNIFEAL